MFISLLGKDSKTLLQDFDAANVEYSVRRPRPGVIMNSGEVVEILSVAIPAVATVFVAWLNTRQTRKIIITLNDNTIVHVEGRSVAEVEKLLIIAKTIVAIDAKPPENKSAP
jgi:Effector Associated Constant Component 1